jgi:hypothetical protein
MYHVQVQYDTGEWVTWSKFTRYRDAKAELNLHILFHETHGIENALRIVVKKG